MEQKKKAWKHTIVASMKLARAPTSLDITSISNALQVVCDLLHESWLDNNVNNVNNVLSSSVVGPPVLQFRIGVLKS